MASKKRAGEGKFLRVAIGLFFLAIATAGTLHVLRRSEAQGNLLLITLDTVRADRLGCYGYERISTPNIDWLAANGILFEKAIAAAPLTLPSHATIMTGLYPYTHGVRDNTSSRLSDKAVTLAEILSERGYRTGAIIGAFVLDAQYGLDQGFGFYEDRLPGSASGPRDVFAKTGEEKIQLNAISERPASAVTKRALAWLNQNREEKFFLWIHYYDPHYPYTPPHEASNEYRDSPYDGEIASVDKNLGMVLDQMRSLELIDNTLIVVVGDHGEGLGEHREATHSIFVYEPMVRVPLIMSFPDRLERGERVTTIASLADVMPTILDILEIDNELPMDGMSLLGAIEGEGPQGRIVYTESMFPYLNYGWSEVLSVSTSDWKYIRSTEPELYNVEADPAESVNRIRGEEDIATRLEAALDSLLARAPSEGGGLAEEASLSGTDRERLAALGYISGAPPVREKASLSDPKQMIRYHDLITRAREAIDTGAYEEALTTLREVTSGAPTNALARNMLGMVYYQVGDTASARREFLAAIDLNPNLHDAHHNLGNIQLHQGKLAEAAACYEKAIELSPGTGEYFVALAQIYARMGETEKAEAAYEKAIGHGYSSPELFLANGITLMRLGRFEEARKSFEDAIAIDQSYVGAYNEYGTLLEKMGDLQGAARKYQQALSIDPDYAKSHYNLARILLKANKQQEASKELLLTIENEPDHAEAHYLIGELYFRQGETGKAKEHLSQFLALGTTNQAAKTQAEAHLSELR